MDFVRDTISEYRRRADERRTEGADSVAQLYDKVAGELEAGLEKWENGELSVVEATKWSGYTDRQIRRLRSNGLKLTRKNLPRKGITPARPALVTSSSGRPSLADQIVRRRSA